MTRHITKEEIFDVSTKNLLSDVRVARLLEMASLNIGEINNIVSNVLEFDFIISALKNIESLNSARIEGTTGNLKDLYLEDSLNFEQKKQLKLFSAVNYQTAITKLETITSKQKGIDKALVRSLHKLLTEEDPATKGTPGKFRAKEVIIRNSKLGDFWPAHPLKIDEYMDEFIKGLELMRNYPSLIQAAIAHYQFESIHPFEDGNGRTGRLLIITSLLLNKTVNTAIINLSQYFDSNRDEYLYSLRSVSEKSDYSIWIKFFLEALLEQGTHNIKLIEELRKIKESDELLVNEKTHSPATLHILNHALNKLYISIPDTMAYLNKKGLRGDLRQMARNNIRKLVQLGILDKTTTKKGRVELYVHMKLKKKLMSQDQT